MMGRRWEKDRASRDGVASKMSATWTDIFSSKDETIKMLERDREEKMAERHNAFLALSREKFEFDRERMREKFELEKARLKMEQEEAWLKIQLEKQKLSDAMYLEDPRIICQDASTLEETIAKGGFAT